LPGRLDFNFSHSFEGIVWSTLVVPDGDIILLEVRYQERKAVTFSALDYQRNTFLWRDMKLDEPWWVNLSAASQGVMLFTIYLETNNPDKKGILAYALVSQKLLWWSNDFSILRVWGDKVSGMTMKWGTKEVVLDLLTGKEITGERPEPGSTATPKAVKPLQYIDGTPYFETVKTFLGQKLNLLPVLSLEYLEHNTLIFISYYVMEDGLANYLLVLSGEGDLLLKEKIDSQLKGIGLDTFFILDGCVFFVKNKVELVSYKIV
jgi:hypothetical protein